MQTEKFKKHGVLWTRRVCIRRKLKKKKKNDDQTKQSLQEKETHKKGSDRGKNNQERELKKNNVQKHMRIKRKKRNFEKNKQTCKDKNKYETSAQWKGK